MTDASIDWTTIIGAMSLEVVIITSAVGVVWKLARSEISIRAEAERRVAEVREDATDAIKAISDKLYQVEIWARDEFVRKGSFETVIARMEAGFRDLRTEIGSRLDKMTERIEKIGHSSD